MRDSEGNVTLTKSEQQEVCDLVEKFYKRQINEPASEKAINEVAPNVLQLPEGGEFRTQILI